MPDLQAQNVALKAALRLLGFDPEQLVSELCSGDDHRCAHLALRSALSHFDEWTAHRLAPRATLPDLETARRIFEAVYPLPRLPHTWSGEAALQLPGEPSPRRTRASEATDYPRARS